MKKVFLMVITLLIGIQSQGLVNGTEDNSLDTVVKLGINSRCTGIVVGTKPLTILTARHCAKLNVVQLWNGNSHTYPTKIIDLDFGQQEFDFRDVSKVPLDIAVLTYESEEVRNRIFNEKNIFSVAPVEIGWGTKIKICGFGIPSPELFGNGQPIDDRGMGYQRCGSNFVLTDNPDFRFPEVNKVFDKYNTMVALAYYKPFEITFDFSDLDLIKIMHATEQYMLNQFGAGTRLALGPFKREALNKLDPNFKNALDTKAGAHTHQGDSGAPWFIEEAGVLHVVGITSFGIPMLRNPEINPSVNVIANNFAWRIDHPSTKSLLKKAAVEGADIRGIDQLLAH